MKQMLWRIFFAAQLILVPLFNSVVYADPTGSSGGVPVGAPIDNGVFVLIALGIAYGCYKLYLIRRKKLALKEAPILGLSEL
jgi:hypothetical protein